MADVKLTEDLSIVSNSSIEIEMLGDDLNIIQKLDDEPNDVGGMSSAELKATFDKAGLTIQKYINETLIPKIVADDATEAARSAAEDARAAAESERQSAESTRNTSEESRVEAEEDRVSSESLRKSAEELRISAETARQNAESGRLTAEQSRAEAEQLRAEAEQLRSDEEALRASAEQSRITNETARTTAESGRTVEEAKRVTAEQNRITAEQARAAAETQRIAAETDRQSKSSAMQVWEEYDSSRAYVPLNKVTWNGSSYICIQPCAGVQPDNGNYWLMIARKGVDGTTVSASGQYSFAVEDGHLILYYTGDTPPNFTISDDGHLILHFDDTHTMDIGAVIGPRGPAGPGVPEGGTPGQVLVKSSETNYDTKWENAPSGSGSESSYTLPIASENTLGGVKPVAKTAEMTQSVGVDEAGGLWAKASSGGGSAEAYSVEYTTGEMTEDVDLVRLEITDNDMWRKIINADYIKIEGTVIKPSDGTTTGKVSFGLASSAINSAMSVWVKYFDNQSILSTGKGLFNVKFGGFLDPKIADSDISYNGNNSRNAVASVYVAVNNGGVKISNVPTTLRLGVFQTTSFLLTCTTKMGAGTVFTVTAIKE